VALPDILRTTTIARSRLFEIEELELRFANGAQRIYERLPAVGPPAVMIAALDDQHRVLLIREYAAGFHEYQLTLPKGAAEPGETLIDAANRELKEECGFGARSLVKLAVAGDHPTDSLEDSRGDSLRDPDDVSHEDKA